MSVLVSVEEAGPCQKRLKVEVPAATVAAETDRVTNEYRGQAKLPGFRKGKVPADIVRQRFGKEIEQEVVDRLLPRYWRQAEAEAQLEPLLPPKVEDVNNLEGAPMTFTAVVEVRPEFALAELDGFELPAPKVEVDAAEIDSALDDLRRSLAPWVDVEQPAANGLLVEAKLAETTEGDGDPEVVAFEVGDPNVWEELSIEVVGKTVGQKGRFERVEPGPESEERRRAFELEITAIKEKELPELDDELASRIGGFAGVDELRTDVAQRLAAGKEREARRLRENAVLDQLRQRNPAEMPPGVVDAEIRHLLTDYAEGLGARGVDPSTAQIDWSQLADQIRPQAEAQVHARLLLDAVARSFELEVPEDEFEATLARLAKAQGQSTARLRQALDRDGRLQQLRAQLLRERALKRLLGEDPTTGGADDGASREEP